MYPLFTFISRYKRKFPLLLTNAYLHTMKMKKLTAFISFLLISLVASAQSIHPYVTYTDKKTLEVDTLKEGAEPLSAEAPLKIHLYPGIDCPSNLTYRLEWKIYPEKEGEQHPVIDRFEDESEYTLLTNGTFCIKLYATFFDINGSETTLESEEIKITIAESKLTCPDGFSPNGDGHNDNLVIKCKSIVKMNGIIFNRWGQKIRSISLDNLQPKEEEEEKYIVWDGMIGGKPAKDGVYFINIDATGSDGIRYKIKKAINVLKGYRESNETGI